MATLVNVIARGAVADVDARNGGGGCSASHSNLRPEASPQLVLGAGLAWHINQIYSVRLEHQRLTEVGQEDRSGTEDIDYTALGFIIRF